MIAGSSGTKRLTHTSREPGAGFRCMYTTALEEAWLLNYENSTLNQRLLIGNIAEDVCGGGTCAEFQPLLAGLELPCCCCCACLCVCDRLACEWPRPSKHGARAGARGPAGPVPPNTRLL